MVIFLEMKLLYSDHLSMSAISRFHCTVARAIFFMKARFIYGPLEEKSGFFSTILVGWGWKINRYIMQGVYKSERYDALQRGVAWLKSLEIALSIYHTVPFSVMRNLPQLLELE